MLNREKMESLKRKIMALSKMTTENGCSESEALGAAKRLADLLDEHGLSLDEIRSEQKAGTASCEKDSWGMGANAKEAFWCAGAVAKLFDLIWYRSKTRNEDGYGAKIVFYGLTQDVMAGKYLLGIIQTAMETEWKAWYNPNSKAPDRGHGRSVRSSFMMGMSDRINERLIEMKALRNQSPTTGTALVVVKDQIVKAEWAKQGVKLRNVGRSRSMGCSAEARTAGRAAGDRVSLSTGPNINGTRKLGNA